MKRFWGILSVIVFFTINAYAYLATPSELRQFWDRQRQIRGNLYLRYESQEDPPQVLEAYIRSDGLWAKRVTLNGSQQREQWKWGLDSWQQKEQTWKKAARKNLSWEDWLFEPKIDVLLALTPIDTIEKRGLGMHPEGQVWLYGARSQTETTSWLGLLRNNIRLGYWNSTNPEIGRIELDYDSAERYPKEIIFHRQDRPQYRLTRRALVWNPSSDRGFQKPAAINLDARRMPIRPAQHVTTPTDR